jgi:hypothetical protein
MRLQQMNFSQFNSSKLRRPARGHILTRIDSSTGAKINSVFLSNKNFRSKVNWQTELLKLEDAS